MPLKRLDNNLDAVNLVDETLQSWKWGDWNVQHCPFNKVLISHFRLVAQSSVNSTNPVNMSIVAIRGRTSVSQTALQNLSILQSKVRGSPKRIWKHLKSLRNGQVIGNQPEAKRYSDVNEPVVSFSYFVFCLFCLFCHFPPPSLSLSIPSFFFLFFLFLFFNF